MNEQLTALPAATIIGFIADAAERWCNPDFPTRVRATQMLVERTGYSAPVVEYALDRLMSGLTRETLRSAIEDELGSLDALDSFIEREGRPRVHAKPRGRVVIISSRTTIGVALPAAVFALATKNTVIVKDREDGLIRDFFTTLAQEHPLFETAAVAHTWSGADSTNLLDADVVVAFGSDETLTAIRAELPATTEFVGFGSRMSCGYLAYDSSTGLEPVQHILERAARDIVLYDGEGCMSLHVLFVETASPEDKASVQLLAQQLAESMASTCIEFPPSRQPLAAQIASAATHASQSFREAIGKSVGMHAGLATVIIDGEIAPPLQPLSTLIVPVRNEAEVVRYLERHNLRVETLAVECADASSITLSRLIGAHRVTTFGSMQNPDLAGDHGGRSRTRDFVTLIDLESVEPEMFESILTKIPGPRSLDAALTLAKHEARGVTYFAENFPIFWERAKGAIVTDVDGNRFIDCTAAFGVAAVGHGNPHVIDAITRQAAQLMHGMGDVHPSAVRASYLQRLSKIAPGNLNRCFLGSNGADAVEFALKTALLKTNKPSVLFFEGAYHGLSYGTLEVAGIERFRAPFASQLRGDNPCLPYPDDRVGTQAALATVEALLAARSDIGAILIEPIAGRAGTLVPAPGVLQGLRDAADRFGIVLIFDEIYTGFGRTGTWFACDYEDVLPDVLCLGKAIAGGFPLSAAIGNEATFSAWPRSSGEAIHTSTYLGNPMACAAGHAVLDEIESLHLINRAAETGAWLGLQLAQLARRLEKATDLVIEVRGRGMMWALDLNDAGIAVSATVHALHRGLIVLPQGVDSTAIALTPPLVISKEQLLRALDILENAVFASVKQSTSERQKETL